MTPMGYSEPRRTLSAEERVGWQLLLWSYRHELEVNSDDTDQEDTDDGTHRE